MVFSAGQQDAQWLLCLITWKHMTEFGDRNSSSRYNVWEKSTNTVAALALGLSPQLTCKSILQRQFQQGLPQGSVLSPLLFLFFMNSVVEAVLQKVTPALYADNLFWHNISTKNVPLPCYRRQWTEWLIGANGRRWCWKRRRVKLLSSLPIRMKHHGHRLLQFKERNEHAVQQFSEVTWHSVQPHPQFSHLSENVCWKVLSHCRVLRALAAKSWGWRKDNLCRVYLAPNSPKWTTWHQGGNHDCPNRCRISWRWPRTKRCVLLPDSTNPRL